MCKILELNAGHVNPVRYQLLHRTASAIIEALRFNAKSALMLVHSFSSTNEWFYEFEKFAGLYDTQAEHDKIISLGRISCTELYLGWVKGEVS